MFGDKPKGKFKSGPAATTPISLSQALLAPLDAIFKAQIHAARSFLNLILQIGFPHQPVDENGQSVATEKGALQYNQDFYYQAEENGKTVMRKVSIPALTLVPIAPLAVESAEFKFAMKVEEIASHDQIQESEAETVKKEKNSGFDHGKRPWFLVSDPISLQGKISPSRDDKSPSSSETSFQIEIKVGKIPMPNGLDKLISFLNQSALSKEVKEKPEK